MGKKFLKEYCKSLNDEYSPQWYDFGYWRKCWNVKHRFLHVFDDKGYDGQGGSFNLTIAELDDVVEHVLKYFLNEDNWDDDLGSIWEWHIEVVALAEQIYNIRNFLEDLAINNGDPDNSFIDDNDFEIEFYDSY